MNKPLIIENTENPFEIVDSPWGKIEQWRASAMAIGTMGALVQVHRIVRNDAAELEKKTIELDSKKHQVLRTVNKLLSFMSRVDALTTRVEALEAQRKADQEEQERLEEEPIDLPPDLAAYQSSTPAKEIGDETHHPAGDLHVVEAKEEPSSDLPEPPLEVEEDDNPGDLPEELQIPEPLSEPEPKPSGSVLPQPTALFGN